MKTTMGKTRTTRSKQQAVESQVSAAFRFAGPAAAESVIDPGFPSLLPGALLDRGPARSSDLDRGEADRGEEDQDTGDVPAGVDEDALDSDDLDTDRVTSA